MKNLLKNIKTTIFGAFAGLPILAMGIKTNNVVQIIEGASIFFMGLFAKDNNTKEQD
jgi:hypothetical protein